MSAVDELRLMGFTVEAIGDQVRVAYPAPEPPPAAQPLLTELKQCKAAALRELWQEATWRQREIAWRLAVMRQKMPACGPAFALVVRDRPAEPGRCFSCGEAVGGTGMRRCEYCSQAAWLATSAIPPHGRVQ